MSEEGRREGWYLVCGWVEGRIYSVSLMLGSRPFFSCYPGYKGTPGRSMTQAFDEQFNGTY